MKYYLGKAKTMDVEKTMAFLHTMDPHHGYLQYVYDTEQDGFTQLASDCFSGEIGLAVPADLIVQVAAQASSPQYMRYIVDPKTVSTSIYHESVDKTAWPGISVKEKEQENGSSWQNKQMAV